MKAVVFTLGCKVNAYESASLAEGLKSLGYETSEEPGYADLYVINTCAVTAEAEKKSRQAIARMRKFNPNAKIIVVGCASQKSPDDFLAKENVTLVSGAKSKERILSMLDKSGKDIFAPDEYGTSALAEKSGEPRAFIKVQDGCDNFCGYCIIPYLRGRSRSRSAEEVVAEIERLSPAEAVITGINLSAYDDGEGLKGLIDRLHGVKCRVRLGSLEPRIVTDEFLSSLENLQDFADHFHLSLQSGSDAVLKSMNRHYGAEEFKEKCELIRKHFPNAGITTDVIAGYPTESEEDFSQTLSLAEEVRFSDMHCFPFSPREGTVAAKMKDLPKSVKDERMERLLRLKEKLKGDFIDKNLGKTLRFLPEETEDGYLAGYTGNYIRCYVKDGITERRVYEAKLTEKFRDGAKAEVLKELL